jgi:hypothetical protein
MARSVVYWLPDERTDPKERQLLRPLVQPPPVAAGESRKVDHLSTSADFS